MAYMEEPYNKVANELQEMETAKQQLEEALFNMDDALWMFDKVAGTNFYNNYYNDKMNATEILEDMRNILKDKEEEL